MAERIKNEDGRPLLVRTQYVWAVVQEVKINTKSPEIQHFSYFLISSIPPKSSKDKKFFWVLTKTRNSDTLLTTLNVIIFYILW